jgi:hypothetical protein
MVKLILALSHNYGIKIIAMTESRFTMMNEIKNFEWTSILDLSSKGMNQFNAVGKDMNCSQLMRNAQLDWQVDLKPVLFEHHNVVNASDKLFSLVKDNKEVLVSGLTKSYHPMQNESIAKLGDYVADKTDIKFEHCFSYDNNKYITFLAKTNGTFNIGEDVVNSYMMFNNFHTGRDKSSILTTNISVWCSNTFLNAMKDNSQFKIGITHRVEYSSELDSLIKHKLETALRSNEEYKEQATTLDNKQIVENDLLKYFILVYNPKLLPSYEKEGAGYKALNSVEGSNLTQIKRCYGVWNDTIESNGKSFKLQNTGNNVRNDTYWKAFNCVTYNEDHLRGGSDNISSRLKNNFFTNGKDNIKTKAMNTALELAVA